MINGKFSYINMPENAFEHREGWPGTLPTHRMLRIKEILRKMDPAKHNTTHLSPEEQDDVANALIFTEADLYGSRCMDWIEESNRHRDPEEAVALMNAAAYRADTPNSTGAILNIGSSPSEVSIIIGKILRHPQWVGASNILPLVKGLNAMIIESAKRRGLPGVTYLAPGWVKHQVNGALELPPGEATTLREVFQWHGVKECRWVTAAQVE